MNDDPIETHDTDSDFMRKVKRWYRRDYEHQRDWREEAREDYAFVAGEQWTEEEEQALKAQMRPIVSFNRIAPVVNAIGGTEVTNRQEVRFIPREQGDIKQNELLTGAALWFRDEADADEEDSEAFLDAAICGVGVTETRLDFEEDPDGTPVVERIDPLYVLWDCNAKRVNLTDRKRQWYVTRMPLEEAQEQFPDADPFMLNADWATEMHSDDENPDDQEAADRYEGESDQAADDEGLVTIVQLQWIEREPVHRVVDSDTGEEMRLSPEEFKIYDEAHQARFGGPARSVRQTRRVYRQAFIGREVLKLGGTPREGHFSFNFITGWRDRNKGTWYGIVRMMKDPQRWSNKWMSQTMHILNNNAKGGVVVERSAVDNAAEFERSWAKADKVTYVRDGTLSQNKIQDKPMGQFPAGFYQMMEMAVNAVRDVSGVSLEMLGMREVDQPGILEYQRRQQGMTLLANLFSNLKKYRKESGRLLLQHILHDLSDGRIVRIVGQQGAQYVPLLRQNMDVQYDVIVDDAPTSPNQREMVWSFFGPRMEQFPPPIQAKLLEFSPLPSSVSQEIGEMLAPKPSPEQQRQADMAAAMQEVEIIKAQAEAQDKLTEAYKQYAEAVKVAAEVGLPAPPELPQPALRPMQRPMQPPQGPPPGPPPGAPMPNMNQGPQGPFSLPNPPPGAPVNGAGMPLGGQR